jgi:hypothetical protein
MNRTWNLRDDPANYDDEGNYVEELGTMDTHPWDWENEDEEKEEE